ncbi:hypothetical protein OIE13_27950 [Streptosporangium sp. NBC_01810]|uniref:hypothetical protein n=1 Tax=Streptosporangium sp. NBC_01810 TaxID=2975951 RepID=UPI002DD9963B|nr:hypothetical protein [Streptosporangium sp. NBC_01810]WSA24741.1 hypothetical protein OIE13_27950 [Streptosporangium sp. NBC_01810]
MAEHVAHPADHRPVGARRRPRRGSRIVANLILLAMLTTLYGLLLHEARSTTADHLAAARTARQAVPLLRSTTQLLTELVQARTAAAHTAPVNVDAIAHAAAAVSTAGQTADVKIRQRSVDLRAVADALGAEKPSGPYSVQRYDDAIVLATDLLRMAGATARLDADPDLYHRFLAELVVERLPAVVVGAGQIADRLALDAGATGAARERASLAVAVARSEVASAVEALDTGIVLLAATPEGAVGRDVGRDVAGPLDEFRKDAGRLAAPAVLEQTRSLTGAADAAKRAERVRESATALATAAFAALDQALQRYQQDVDWQHLQQLAMLIAGVVLGGLLLYRSIPARYHDDEVDGTADTTTADVASLSINLPEVDARELLAMEELVHVGRGVRVRPSDGSGDAP